jgi:cell division protease FtsH
MANNNHKVKKFEFKLNLNPKRILVWSLILFLFVPFLVSVWQLQGVEEEVPVSQVLTDIKADKVAKVVVLGEAMKVTYKEGKTVLTHKEAGESFTAVLSQAGIEPTSVAYENRIQNWGTGLMDMLGTVLPVILIGTFFLMLMRQAKGTQDTIFSFGRSRAKRFAQGKQQVTFKDVGGIDEAKKELEEIVDFLKNPKKYSKVGARTPKGALLIGPSGTGKTLLARAIAGEANVPFFSMAGSEFMEMLVGVGSARMRDLFDTAKKSAPAIVFIDEIDAIGRMRGFMTIGGHGEQEQTLNQLLVEMDGFTPNEQIVVICATNRSDALDPALMRPGRFDRRISLDLPDLEEREKILQIHARGKPFRNGFDWKKVAKRTVGFSGADLENMLNEAAILAAREDREAINLTDVEEAATKVKLGPARKRLQNKLERKMTAYHEGGHAVVGHLLPHTDPVHRVSIVSRDRSLGDTQMVPERDKYQQTRSELVEMMAAFLGGRAAEELVFGELTAGAANDIDRATRIARQMVADLGMSDLGPVNLGPQWETTEWGRAMFEPTNLSPEMQAKVDREIKRLVDEAYKVAAGLLKKHRGQLDRVAEKLMAVETLDGEEFAKLMGVPKARPKGEE